MTVYLETCMDLFTYGILRLHVPSCESGWGTEIYIFYRKFIITEAHVEITNIKHVIATNVLLTLSLPSPSTWGFATSVDPDPTVRVSRAVGSGSTLFATHH